MFRADLVRDIVAVSSGSCLLRCHFVSFSQSPSHVYNRYVWMNFKNKEGKRDEDIKFSDGWQI